MKLSKNIILNTDSYKVSMFKQYPLGTTGVYSYIESRGGRYDKTVFFGLQAFIKEYLLTPITQADIDIADEILTAHGEPFNRAGWQYILDVHNGYLPVVIRAVAEGTVVPVKNVLATIENTGGKNTEWLTTWLETPLLRAIWYPTTVSTQSKMIKNLITEYLEKSGDPTTIAFKLHDFGARGVSSMESAGIGCAAHLVNFMGTDTITGVLFAREYYNAGIAGFSIPAAEHSTITSWGRAGEVKAYSNMVKQFGTPGALLAVVSDSYDIYEACRMWGTELKQQVIDSGATVVIRPDSGDPVEVLPKMFQILGETFGYTTNSKGYKVLNNVRILWGDGINQLSIHSILTKIVDFGGWSADNIAFGMGGALLQQLDRDTQKFAMKCSAAEINGEWVDVFKDPITDKVKASKKGRVTLWTNGGEFETSVERPTRWTDKGSEWTEALEEVFRDGKLVKEITFEEVRANSMT